MSHLQTILVTPDAICAKCGEALPLTAYAIAGDDRGPIYCSPGCCHAAMLEKDPDSHQLDT